MVKEDLLKQIELMRERLNRYVDGTVELSSEEVVYISQQLDVLIVKYIRFGQ
jgi:hypothetical protein